MIDFLNKLKYLGKIYYSITDLKKITGLKENSLYVFLSRCVKKKIIVRLRSGIYILPDQYNKLETIANDIYSPSYLSFESALSRYGIISQIPYRLTFATTRKTWYTTLGETTVEYRKIKSILFTEYENNGSIYIATPEKAIIDSLYLASFGKMILDMKDIKLNDVNLNKMKKLLRIFPERTQLLAKKLLTK